MIITKLYCVNYANDNTFKAFLTVAEQHYSNQASNHFLLASILMSL